MNTTTSWTQRTIRNSTTVLLAALLVNATEAQLIPPFNPAAPGQDNVLATQPGVHNQEGASQATEVYKGKIYYTVKADGTANPAKVYCFDPVVASLTVVASAPNHLFFALKQMNGLLWISHWNGKLFTFDGSVLSEVTPTPFTSANWVSSMSALNGKMYFATSAGHVYESADGVSFVLKQSFTAGKAITALTAWNGQIYAANSEDYSYASKIYRSADGASWNLLGTFPAYSFYGFVPTATHLYLASVEDAGGASFSIRSTTNGTGWTQILYTTTEGKGLCGRPTYFSQTGKAYFSSSWFYSSPSQVTRIFPVANGVAEPGIILNHGFTSFAEVDGQMYGIGSQDMGDWNGSPHVVSRLGKYTTLLLGKAVYLESHTLFPGTNYQLQVSSDMLNWTNQGPAFIASATHWRSTNYWDVANWDKLFFRFQAQ